MSRNKKILTNSILFLVIFSMCLISTILIATFKPPINNIINEPVIINRSKPIEKHDFELNLTHTRHTIGIYTIGQNEIYFLNIPYPGGISSWVCTIIEDIWFDLWNETNGDVGIGYVVGMGNSPGIKWTAPYLSNWIITCYVHISYLTNPIDFTAYDSITTII